MAIDDCDDCCFMCTRGIVGYFCCCRSMRNSSRIKFLWAWLIICTVTSCLLLGCVVYAPDYPLLSPSDMRPIRNNVNFLFCEEVLVTSPGPNFNGYVVSGDLTMAKNKRLKFDQSTAVFIGREAYSELPLYLLVGSKLKLKHCAEEGAVFYLIRGRDNLKLWKRYRSCDTCYVAKQFLFPGDLCIRPRSQAMFEIDIQNEDEYFIVYSNDNTDPTWVNIDISLDRSVFDIQNATVYCIDIDECELILQDPDDIAVIWVNTYFDITNKPTFTTKCVPRIWAYLVLHGLPLLFLGISFSILIQRLCRDSVGGAVGDISERSPLLPASPSPPLYSRVIMSPPKYEDIIRGMEPPPSYADAVASLTRSTAWPTSSTASDAGTCERSIEPGSSSNSYQRTVTDGPDTSRTSTGPCERAIEPGSSSSSYQRTVTDGIERSGTSNGSSFFNSDIFRQLPNIGESNLHEQTRLTSQHASLSINADLDIQSVSGAPEATSDSQIQPCSSGCRPTYGAVDISTREQNGRNDNGRSTSELSALRADQVQSGSTACSSPLTSPISTTLESERTLVHFQGISSATESESRDDSENECEQTIPRTVDM